MSHQRYGCWSEQAPPPLPAKRRGGSGDSDIPRTSRPSVESTSTQGVEAVHASDAVTMLPSNESAAVRTKDVPTDTFASVSLSGDERSYPIEDVHPIESSCKVGCGIGGTAGVAAGAGTGATATAEGADERIVQEIVRDPSQWILMSRETGQELNAQAFVEALMLLTAPRHNPFNPASRASTPQTPLAPWSLRRQRSNRNTLRRPSLLPHGIGIDVLNDGGSQLALQSMPVQHSSHWAPEALLQPMASRSKSPGGRASKSPGSRAASSMPARPSLPTRASNRNIVSNGGDGIFSLSRVRPAQVLRDLHAGGIRAMCFSPSGDYFATAGADNRALVFRVRQRRDGSSRGAAPRVSTGGLMSLLGTTPEEGRPSALADVHTECAMPLLDDVPFRVLSGHFGEVVALSWAPDDSALLTASADGTVRCWRPRDGDKCAAVYEHGGRVTSVAWDPVAMPGVRGGGRFLTGCMDGKLRIFSVDSVDSEVEAWVLAERPVTAVEFSPGGAGFVAGLVGGGVRFYRTEGMVQELTAECRRHGIRQHARLATSPVRRLSVGGNRGNDRSNGNGVARRSSTMAQSSSRGSRSAEGRVTGFCFRPQGMLLSDVDAAASVPTDSPGIDQEESSSNGQGLEQSADDVLPFSLSIDSVAELRNADEHETTAGDDSLSERALASRVRTTVRIKTGGNEHQGVWAGSRADVLVSTNDSRARVLDPGRDGGVAVRLKLKGHNTEGALGQHMVAKYSDDGELVVSGSTDGYVHVWPALGGAPPTSSKRAVAWSSSREGYERVLVCAGKVAVPAVLFAPDSVARSIGGDATRIIVTGDAEGSVKFFIG